MSDQIDATMLSDWRINYGLDTRTPAEAMRWWYDRMDGKAPAGAVAALGLCIDEIERLTANIKKANDQAEHFERHWYLRGDEIERLRAALVAAMAIVQQDRVSLYECSRNQATGEIEPEDAAAIAELDAIIAQADVVLKYNERKEK